MPEEKAPSSGGLLAGSVMYFCSGWPMHFCSGVDRVLRKDRKRYAREHKRVVIDPNYRDIKNLAMRLRASYREPLLEPASLEIAKWRHIDYTALWEVVIERFANRIVLMPGWEFSVGCALEVQKALCSGLRITTPDGSPISLDCAIEQLRAAADELARDGVPVQVGGVVLALDELRSTLNGRQAPAKYRDKAGRTWTGKGARPIWLREKLRAGAKLEELAVPREALLAASLEKSKRPRRVKR